MTSGPRSLIAALRRTTDALHAARYLLAMIASPTQRKHAWAWLRSQRPGYLLNAPAPWITFDAIDFLGASMREGLRVFEYGSGGSTLFWLAHGSRITSIEHDPRWFATIRQRLRSSPSVDYRLIEPDPIDSPSAVLDPADPRAYASSDPAFAGYSFRRYASQIDDFPDETFDVVLVDGRARPSCVLHSGKKVKLGGLLILDNADIPTYTSQTQDILRDFTVKRFYGVGPCGRTMWRTDVYVRTS